MSDETLYFDVMDSPVGPLRLIADDQGLRRVVFPVERHPQPQDHAGRRDAGRLAFARRQLEEYFDGTRRRFELPLHPLGTEFQLRVWNALCSIEFGDTCSYADIANALGQPTATRAVGAANGRNPIPIIVPCHRVIGRDGSLVGFGGGLAIKAHLLALERRDLFSEPAAATMARRA